MSQWHGGKGDLPRKESISLAEKDLRWELAFEKPSAERKKEIEDLLEKIQKGK